MTLKWHRTTELYVEFPVTPVNAEGASVTISGVDCALLPYRSRGPATSTVWKAAVYTPGVGGAAGSAKILVSGPDANDPGSAGFRFGDTDYGGDLWARTVDNPETDPEFVARIDLIQ